MSPAPQNRTPAESAWLQALGARLARERRRQGVSLVELAERVGSKGTRPVQLIEAGRAWPTSLTLLRIARGLDVDLGWLVTGRGKPQPPA